MTGASDPLQKPWGWSTRLYCSDNFQVERITIRAGGYSSIHLHERKVNQFVVSSGTLCVTCFDSDLKQTRHRDVTDASHFQVTPCVRHQFIAVTDVEGYEVYWSQPSSSVLDPDDIIRFSANGVIPLASVNKNKDEAFAYCCKCNKPFASHKLVTACVDSAIRDVCESCLRSMEPQDDNDTN